MDNALLGEIESASCNVFADLGFADAEEMQAKTRLTVRILDSLESRKLSPLQAARLLGLREADIKALRQARLDQFTMDQLWNKPTA